MKVIARCNSVALVEDGRQLALVEQRGAHLELGFFVGLLSSVAFAVNGLIQVGRLPWIGVALLAMSALAGIVALHAARARRKRAKSTTGDVQMFFDMDTRTVRDRSGAPLTSFAEAQLQRTFQPTSSSRALTLLHGAGGVVIARGNPIGDSVEAIEEALLQRGIGRPAP